MTCHWIKHKIDLVSTLYNFKIVIMVNNEKQKPGKLGTYVALFR